MHTDRELLEWAAKAAGMEHMRWSGPCGLSRMIDPTRPDGAGSIGGYWNPLTDDGDALRLAVRLNLLNTRSPGYEWPVAELFDAHSDDPYAATRRAITMAAAQIGRAMK